MAEGEERNGLLDGRIHDLVEQRLIYHIPEIRSVLLLLPLLNDIRVLISEFLRATKNNNSLLIHNSACFLGWTCPDFEANHASLYFYFYFYCLSVPLFSL